MNRRAAIIGFVLLLLALLCWAATVLFAPRIVLGQAEPYALAAAFIPGQGDAAGWVYIEAPGDVTTSCTGCALGTPHEQRSARGVVRTQVVRALWPGWELTTTTTVGRSVTLTRGSVVRLPWVGR